jgi:hypothetical protein
MTVTWEMPIPAGPKMVLLALCDNANDQGECYPSIQTIAKKCSMSERSVFSHIDYLERGFALKRENRKGRSSIYHLDPCKFCTPEDIAPTPANSSPAPANLADTPANSAPRIITKPLLKSPSNLNPSSSPEKQGEEEKLQSVCRETWKSYSNAYFSRYQTEPIRNASVNTFIKTFCKKIPHHEAPHVAAFFVAHNDKFYIQRTHHPSLMSKDAEGLRTQWATGRTMTATKANQLDKTASNFNSVNEAIEMLRKKNHATV